MEAVNYCMDVIFVTDIIINFRTIYLDERTGDPIKDTKMIARNYILYGRFFVDLISAIPIEFVGEIEGSNISKGTLKLISLVKLTRLLRLGRVITYIKMSKSFRHGIKIFIVGIYLFLVIHWIDCASYYVFQVDGVWMPPKDIIPNTTIIYYDETDGYFVMFYYASLFLMSNDDMP